MFTDDKSVLIYDNNYDDLHKFSILFYHMYLSGYRQISLKKKYCKIHSH